MKQKNDNLILFDPSVYTCIFVSGLVSQASANQDDTLNLDLFGAKVAPETTDDKINIIFVMMLMIGVLFNKN